MNGFLSLLDFAYQTYYLSMYGLTLPFKPLYVVVISAVIIFSLNCPNNRVKYNNRWRVAYSRKWLNTFAQSNGVLSDGQRWGKLRSLDCFLFEEVLITCFENRGYRVQRPRYTRDGGIDGKVYLGRKLVLIQAKRYKASIKKAHVRNFITVVADHKALGLFIHTGRTPSTVTALLADNPGIELVNGYKKLLCLLDGKPITLLRTQLKHDKNLFIKPNGTTK
jgi:hypothetical protein